MKAVPVGVAHGVSDDGREIPNIAEHALEGTRWNRMSIDVHDEDYMVTTKKRLSAFYPTDLELLLRNLASAAWC